MMLFGDLAGEEVGLEHPLFVVPPLGEPDVLELEDLGEHGLLFPLPPELAVGPHLGLYPVHHPKETDGRTQPRK